MKTLEKNELKNVKGGRLECHNISGNTTFCVWISADSTWICSGEYTFSGETISLNCGPTNI